MNNRDQMEVRAKNLTAVRHRVEMRERRDLHGHKGGVLWFTGLSGAGKSTLAMLLEQELFQRGYRTYVLDADNVRQGLNKDLGFSPEDRSENIRRIGEVASLFADAGLIVITAFISPYRDDRTQARQINKAHFHEVYIKADLACCEARDPKGLYKKARAGKIPEFTGVSAPFEEPEHPDLIVDTTESTVAENITELIAFVKAQFENAQS
ncbi:adenylyl-sulfate kinase [Magnetococcales bacterium HHB-1]